MNLETVLLPELVVQIEPVASIATEVGVLSEPRPVDGDVVVAEP
jgi:hypothetical protein